MKTQKDPAGRPTILDEIMENAVSLPVESQDLLLMMAKAMRHTRDCLIRQAGGGEQVGRPEG